MNVHETLVDLGFQLKDCGAFWQTTAIFRNGDNPTAIQIYKDSGVWKDYVEDTPFLPFLSLVQKTLGTENPDALRSYTSEGLTTKEAAPLTLLKEEKVYPASCTKRLLPHYDFYLDRGISQATLERYTCGLATSGKFYQRLTFPIYNRDGDIHGFSGRSVTDREPKWLHMGQKSNWFYPYYNCVETPALIKTTRTVFLVESIGDSLSLSENGYANHICSFGISLGPRLISRLSVLDVDYIGIAFNNDESEAIEGQRGKVGAIKALIKLSKFIDLNKLWLTLPIKNDFGDMGAQDYPLWEKGLKSTSHETNMLNAVGFLDDLLKTKTRWTDAFKKDVKAFKNRVDFHYG